jgi:hypothetical protein
MLCQVRSRIDHRDLAGADDIGLGAGEGERRRVGGEQPANARRNLLRPTIRRCIHARAMRRVRRRGQVWRQGQTMMNGILNPDVGRFYIPREG